MINDHINEPNNGYSKSQLSELFDQIQNQMKQNDEIEKQTDQNLQALREKSFPDDKNPKDWNATLSTYLRVLRQYLRDNQSELEFNIDQKVSQDSKIKNNISGWLLMFLNEDDNYKGCVKFQNCTKSYDQLKEDLKEISYICGLVSESVASLMQIDKKNVNILKIEKVKGSNKDIEVQFLVEQQNTNMIISEIDCKRLETDIISYKKNNLCTGVEVYKKKIYQTLSLSYDYFLSKHSRNWDSLVGQVDVRGIKNGQKQAYHFPCSWYGISIDVSNFAIDQEWLSMNENNTLAWPVGYLPGRSTPVRQQENVFTSQKIGQGYTVYRKPEQMEQKCDIVIDPLTKQKYKIGFLCRVDLDKLKQPKDIEDVYVVQRIKEVRPYRILFKKVN